MALPTVCLQDFVVYSTNTYSTSRNKYRRLETILRTFYTALLVLAAAGAMPAGTISLINGNNLVSFNGNTQVIKLGEDCTTGNCIYGGSQALPGGGTLKWQFLTPKT